MIDYLRSFSLADEINNVHNFIWFMVDLYPKDSWKIHFKSHRFNGWTFYYRLVRILTCLKKNDSGDQRAYRRRVISNQDIIYSVRKLAWNRSRKQMHIKRFKVLFIILLFIIVKYLYYQNIKFVHFR